MKNIHILQENDYTALLKPVGTKQTAVEWLVEQLCIKGRKTLINQAKSIEKQQIFDALSEQIVKEQETRYSEEDMEIIEISSVDANYIPHYQTKEGQLLATKFNVEKFKNK